MRFIPNILYIAGSLFLMLSACRQPQYYGHESDYFRPVDTQTENNRYTLKDEQNISKERENCIQGIPQRVIDTNVLSGAEYKQIDFIGYEKIILPTGDKLLIINWGCTTYNLTFRFETSRFGTDTTKVKYWYNTLAQLLGLVEPVIKSPVNIRQGINEIHQFIKQDTIPLVYNIPLSMSHDSIYSEINFERVKALADTAVRLDVTFSLGNYLQKP